MSYYTLSQILIFQVLLSSAQTYQTEVIELGFDDESYVVFNILLKNPDIEFDNNIKYTWYNRYSGIGNTKGGTGGKLLHGKYQFFNESRRLVSEVNFSQGIKHGVSKDWGEKGEVINHTKYEYGVPVYMRFPNDNDQVIEWIGKMLDVGSIKNVYDKSGKVLIAKMKFLKDFMANTTVYYENSNLVEAEFLCGLDPSRFYGYYKEYYKNGNLRIDGNYDNLNRVGEWKYFDAFGNQTSSEKYRILKEYFPNGLIKIEGSEYYDPAKEIWIRDGYWRLYTPEGDHELTIYDSGKKVKELTNY